MNEEDENIQDTQPEEEGELIMDSSMAFTDGDEEVEVDIDVDAQEEPKAEDKQEDLQVGFRRGGGRLVGKHSLKHDSIFKGREHNTPLEESYFNEDVVGSFELDTTTDLVQEITDQEEHDRLTSLKSRVHHAVVTFTDVDPLAPRRKPAKADFNRYFSVVYNYMPVGMFSEAEVFVELSTYFSDNLYGMFKLLDKERSEKIIKDLMTKYNLSMFDDLDFQ